MGTIWDEFLEKYGDVILKLAGNRTNQSRVLKAFWLHCQIKNDRLVDTKTYESLINETLGIVDPKAVERNKEFPDKVREGDAGN